MKYCLKESQINPAIHEVLSGPYASESECLGGCDQSSSSTSGSSSNLTSPLVVARSNGGTATISNPNTISVSIAVEAQYDGNWFSCGGCLSVAAGSSCDTNLVGPSGWVLGGTPIRVRCAGEGSTSPWNIETQPNPSNLTSPLVVARSNGGTATISNPNTISVSIAVEAQYDGNWFSCGGCLSVAAGSSCDTNLVGPSGWVLGGTPIRVRCAGEGSTSPWS